jgi:hypothetical protein
MKAVIENGKVKVEILPNLWLRLRPQDVKSVTRKVILFKNPVSGLNCLAHLE